LIALSDISILSSGQEGLPRCILQSIVGGRPTVAFDLPGLEAIVSTGDNGLIVPMDDWTAFGRALMQLAGDADLRVSMAAAAKASDLSNWDWRRMGPRTDAFYEQILSARGSRTRATA
jgi:glycosyltransferase involved in cell wall biosynthesis